MQDKVNKFKNRTREWELAELIGFLPDGIIRNIRNIFIPVLDVRDKIFWKYTGDEGFTIKTVTKAKLLNRI